jgi:hypothetical protein
MSTIPPKEEEYSKLYSRYVDLAYNTVGHKAENLLKQLVSGKINKDFLLFLCLYCANATGMYRPRPLQRRKKNALFYLNLNFEVFEPYLRTINVEKVFPEAGAKPCYKVTICGEEFLADKSMKIKDMYGGERAQKADLDKEIQDLKEKISEFGTHKATLTSVYCFPQLEANCFLGQGDEFLQPELDPELESHEGYFNCFYPMDSF